MKLSCGAAEEPTNLLTEYLKKIYPLIIFL